MVNSFAKHVALPSEFRAIGDLRYQETAMAFHLHYAVYENRFPFIIYGSAGNGTRFGLGADCAACQYL